MSAFIRISSRWGGEGAEPWALVELLQYPGTHTIRRVNVLAHDGPSQQHLPVKLVPTAAAYDGIALHADFIPERWAELDRNWVELDELPQYLGSKNIYPALARAIKGEPL